jgi:hypothetical protein
MSASASLIGMSLDAHRHLMCSAQTQSAMMTRGMKTRRQLRSARVEALTPEERSSEMIRAEARAARQDDGAMTLPGDAAPSVVPPHVAGT